MPVAVQGRNLATSMPCPVDNLCKTWNWYVSLQYLLFASAGPYRSSASPPLQIEKKKGLHGDLVHLNPL